jgi:ABC-type hemin transport system ATPase subunit
MSSHASLSHQVHDEGIAFLRSLGDGPLAIVAVAGPARAGKSFFLNNLAGVGQATDDEAPAQAATAALAPDGSATVQSTVEQGFAVGSGVQGVTHGLWLHSKVRWAS